MLEVKMESSEPDEYKTQREIPVFGKPVIGLSPQQHIVVATSYPVSLIISHFPPGTLPFTVILTQCFCLYMGSRKSQICHFVGKQNLFVLPQSAMFGARTTICTSDHFSLVWEAQFAYTDRLQTLIKPADSANHSHKKGCNFGFYFLSKWKTLEEVAWSVC